MFQESIKNGCLTIELSHGKVNAMDLEFCDGLNQRFAEASSSSEVTSVVLKGNGRVFSAGIDLKRWLAEGPEYVQPYMCALEQLFETVFCFPKPVVSLINGHAIAGGCMLAISCDVRLITPGAKIGIIESRLGVPLPTTAIEIVRHVATPSAFRKMVSIGATYVGSQAVEVGLADDCCEDIEPLLVEAVNELTAIPAATFELTKNQQRGPVMRIVQQSKAELFEKYLAIWQSQQTRDAIAEYVEQRLS